ncbi:heterokaryon incompatibility protein-domain-containing protein, partial [Podospora didyma]
FHTPENSAFYSIFPYSESSLASDNIRLLRIKRPNLENIKPAVIECDLLDIVSLTSHKGRYIAISYCAGNPLNVEIIIVNGSSFNAFANLGHALRQARHFWVDKFEQYELLLWADQVCINQSRLSERTHQVRLMGEIYASSTQVLISLSTEHDTAGGIEWMQQFSQ